jgi:hypothetical protein
LKTEEIVAMMRENAALCNLETEVILALKANAVGDQGMLERQIQNIMVCLQRIDDVRRRNDTRSQSQEEGS